MKAFVIRKQGTEREFMVHADGPQKGLVIGFYSYELADHFCLVELGTTEGLEIVEHDFGPMLRLDE